MQIRTKFRSLKRPQNRAHIAAGLLALITGLTACTNMPFPNSGPNSGPNSDPNSSGIFQRSPASGYADTSSYDFNDGLSTPRPDGSAQNENSSARFQERTPQRGPASLQAPVPSRPSNVENIINSADIALGMNRKEVKESWGMPALVEVAGTDANGNERWTYQEDVATQAGYVSQRKIILFRSDRVVGWKTLTNQN